MNIEKIEFRNIGSFGDKLLTLEYNSDGELIQVKGVSGSGKTTLLNLPKLIAYGKLQGMNKGDISNRVNKNGWVKGYIKSPNGKDVFTIERGFNPSSLEVTKNGVSIDNFGVRDAQQFIDEEIVQIPYSIFNNIISLSLNNFKGFLNLTPHEKKQIIDKIFNLEIINDISDLIRRDIRDLINNINSDNVLIDNINNTIKLSNNELDKLKNTNITEYKNQIEESFKEIERLNNLHKENTEKYKGFYEIYQKLYNTINLISNEIASKNRDVKDYHKKLKLFNADQCPTCETSFKSEMFISLKEELHKELGEVNNRIEELNNQYNGLVDTKQKYDEVNANYTSFFNNTTNTIKELQNNIKLNENTIKNNKQFSSIQNIINDNKKSLNDIQFNVESYNKKLDNLYILDNLYSSDGIKKNIIASYIPVLNETLKEILINLSFPYTLEFDNEFNSTLYQMGEEVPASTLSEGETKKVNVAVLCALLKIIKRKYPSVNIMTLDETLSSLDIHSAESMITYLHTIVKEYKLTCFIVSHIPINSEFITKNIMVEKVGSFSDFEIVDMKY